MNDSSFDIYTHTGGDNEDFIGANAEQERVGFIYIHAYTYIHTYIHTYICICVCVWVCVCMRESVFIHLLNPPKIIVYYIIILLQYTICDEVDCGRCVKLGQSM